MDRLVSTKNAQWMATGHYAGINWHRSVDGRTTSRPKLVRAMDRRKDQTYYLSGVTEPSLRKVRTVVISASIRNESNRYSHTYNTLGAFPTPEPEERRSAGSSTQVRAPDR